MRETVCGLCVCVAGWLKQSQWAFVLRVAATSCCCCCCGATRISRRDSPKDDWAQLGRNLGRSLPEGRLSAPLRAGPLLVCGGLSVATEARSLP